MESILNAIGTMLGVFKDPTQVVLLLIVIAESFAIYKLARFFLDRTDRDLEARVKLATAMEGLTAIIKEKMIGK